MVMIPRDCCFLEPNRNHDASGEGTNQRNSGRSEWVVNHYIYAHRNSMQRQSFTRGRNAKVSSTKQLLIMFKCESKHKNSKVTGDPRGSPVYRPRPGAFYVTVV